MTSVGVVEKRLNLTYIIFYKIVDIFVNRSAPTNSNLGQCNSFVRSKA